MRLNRRKNKNRNPLARVMFGALIVVGAFVLLWRNEGRVNLADVAQKSQPANATAVDPALQGEFVSVTGRLETAVPVNDDRYLRPDDFVQINRWVEIYAWIEDEESDEDGTSYTYEMAWTNDPRPAGEFYDPKGHINLPLTIDEAAFTAESANIGVYRFNPQQIQLPRPEPLALSIQNVQEGPYRIGEAYIFAGKGTLDAPVLGDVRVSFTAVPVGITVTAFGVQSETEITRYNYRDKAELYRVLAGDREQAIARLNTEYKNLLWGFRVFGSGLMWLGLGLLVSPLTALLRFIPVLGNLGRKAVAAVTFFLALLLSFITVVVSALAHSIWALLVLLLLLGGGFYFWQQRQAVQN